MRTGQIASVLAVLGVAACVESKTTRCGDGSSCPVDTACHGVPDSDQTVCVSTNQLAACTDAADRIACVIGEGPGSVVGTCFGGACFPAVCGDNIVDVTEACDVGDRLPGDGCSANCLSREVCGDGVVDLALGEQCDDGEVGRSGDRCSSTCLQEYDLWSDRSARAPVSRTEHAVARAPEGGVMMFGGVPGVVNSNGMSRLGEGWRWDGSSWSELASATPPPSPRAGAVAAYHPGRHHTLLFGGRDAMDVALDDLWQWDGVAWTAVTVSGPRPSARWGASLACSSTRCVLFGGRTMGGLPSGETWIWDGTSWSLLAGSGPSPRSHAAFAYHGVRDVFVLFGGHDTGALGDTWTLETQWTISSDLVNPRADSAPSATFNTTTGSIVLVAAGSTWTQTSTTWNDAQRPYTVKTSALAFDPDRNRVIFVSEARTPSELEALAWSEPLNNREPLAGPLGLISAYAPHRGRTLVVEQGMTWEWDGRSWHHIPTATQLDPRGAAMVFDTACNVAVVFGGLGGSGVGDATWVYDGTWTRRQIAGPSARTLHAMTYDAKRNVVVVFGGVSSPSQLLGDVWELGGPCTARTWTQVPTTSGPSARKSSRLAFDPARGVAVLFGGDDGNERADTWEWDGSTWANRSAATSPPPRLEHAMVYDHRRRAVVMFGGTADTLVFGDTWAWNGTAWAKLSPVTSPPGRRAMTMSLENSGAIVMFGGENAEIGPRRDVWRLALETNLEPVERCAIAAVDEDGDGLTTCEDPDCGWRCAPLCSLGGSCTSPSCGDGTCGAVEDHVMCPADCMAP